MKIKIKQEKDTFHLIAENETGSIVSMDAYESSGGKNLGMKPIELLPASVGGCSSIDVISILKKQKQQIDDLQITVDAERETGKTMNLFTKIHLHFAFKGNLEKEKVERAIELSVTKYCSAAETMRRAGAEVTWSFSIEK